MCMYILDKISENLLGIFTRNQRTQQYVYNLSFFFYCMKVPSAQIIIVI